jgi:uroporphyrinogen decarboxylase
LVVPHALGRDLRFEEGSGPLMTPISPDEVGNIDRSGFHEHLSPVYETVGRLRRELPAAATLIGFCGAPWTVATYMIAGRGSSDQSAARLFAYKWPAAMERLLALLAEVSAEYLIRQIDAGADVVQIFDSWSGVLDAECFGRFCRVRGAHPAVPVIAFPKGAGSRYDGFRQASGCGAVGLDWTVPLRQARRLQAEGPIQGNLDPQRLVAGGRALSDGVDAILAELGGGPLVFNLGHGITPETPIGHVEAMLDRVRSAGHP